MRPSARSCSPSRPDQSMRPVGRVGGREGASGTAPVFRTLAGPDPSAVGDAPSVVRGAPSGTRSEPAGGCDPFRDVPSALADVRMAPSNDMPAPAGAGDRSGPDFVAGGAGCAPADGTVRMMRRIADAAV